MPPRLRARLRSHADDPWATDAHHLWRAWRRERGAERAERALLRHLAGTYAGATGEVLPHVAAGATVLRARCGPDDATPHPTERTT